MFYFSFTVTFLSIEFASTQTAGKFFNLPRFYVYSKYNKITLCI